MSAAAPAGRGTHVFPGGVSFGVSRTDGARRRGEWEGTRASSVRGERNGDDGGEGEASDDGSLGRDGRVAGGASDTTDVEAAKMLSGGEGERDEELPD